MLDVGRGYAEAYVGASLLSGLNASAEVGWRPRDNLTLFGTAAWSPADAYVGAGARLTW